MSRSTMIDLALVAFALYLLACVPALLSEYRDAGVKAATEAPFLRHGVTP